MTSISDSPLTCVDIWCEAGSSFEEDREEGFAHFLEHLVFKGSKNLAAGEFDIYAYKVRDNQLSLEGLSSGSSLNQ